MFTGLIQDVGQIKEIQTTPSRTLLTCQASKSVLAGYRIGDSMAVNGACLTAIHTSTTMFTVEVMPETVKKTTVSQLQVGQFVNLERALSFSQRIEGHLVAGHVDCTTRLLTRKTNQNAVIMTFVYPNERKGELVAQGSVAINGVSLTVTMVTPRSFSVSLLPHSLKETNLQYLYPGEEINLETDMFGKYVKEVLRAYPNPAFITRN